MNMLADGQGQRAYAEHHPAQQALFKVQQYADCVRSAGSLDITGFKVKDIYQEALAIPRTDLTVDSTAVTVELTTNLGTDTDTFFMRWRSAASGSSRSPTSTTSSLGPARDQ